jgi:hypothetical protein
MRAVVVSLGAILVLLAAVDPAEARGGRGGGFRGAKTVQVSGHTPAKGNNAAPHTRSGPGVMPAVIIGAGGGNRAASAKAAEPPDAAAPAFNPSGTAFSGGRVAEAKTPRRPWCDSGTVTGGWCVLN